MDGSVLVVADDIGPTANLVHAVNFSKAFVGRYQMRQERNNDTDEHHIRKASDCVLSAE